MGVQPPYLYDPVKSDGSRSPYKEFDPKAVTRASQEPKPRRPQHEGPLVSFNQHPDSYLILPYGNTNVKPMSASVKKWVKWMRNVQLVLRCFELLCAVGLLVMLILIKGIDATTGWIMRIVPGIAILHTIYGIYHLGRKAAGRPPGSSASYMVFSAFFDLSITPFYAFTALFAKTKSDNWATILQSMDITTLDEAVFLLAAVGASLHLVSLTDSVYLAITFHKIASMPPDMNPLEDNLTSRHKRNKSSMSMATTVLSEKEKRLSMPLESKHSSGALYEDLSRPPTIPFFHTRTQSTTSFSTYKSTPPPSRDARLDLPSRQYQIPPSNSNRSSMASTSDLKRSSGQSSPMKRSNPSYTIIPLEEYEANITVRELGLHNPTRPSTRMSNTSDSWFAGDSASTFSSPRVRSKSSSPRKAPGKYTPLHQRHDSGDELSSYGLPHPLEANPPTPRHMLQPTPPSPVSPLSEISANTNNGNGPTKHLNNYKNHTYQTYKGTTDSRDIADMTYEPEPVRETFKSKYYGDLKPATPPIMIGSRNSRQISSGNDFGERGSRLRDVSGKIAEEGRGGGDGKAWGTRFRKISGL
ncbi:hypothetical protein N431DRAFT_497523 [Stipitochalara longipes BDJ]|nr:hypothetical protein N431DRAFT_497523 [Stipitochalara longipes BDJ]